MFVSPMISWAQNVDPIHQENTYAKNKIRPLSTPYLHLRVEKS